MKENNPVNRIYNRIKSQIMSRSLFPGTRIVEEDLAKEAGMSRTSIRTAMSKLQYEGFVRIVPNKGTFVVKPTYGDIKNVYNTRLYLELGAGLLAVDNITDDAIKRMQENYEAQRTLKDNFSITEYAALNRQFHWEVACSSKNDYYIKYLNEIYNAVHIYMIFYDRSKDNTGSLQSHAFLLDALKARDPALVEQAIRMDNKIGVDDIKAFDF